MKLRLVQVGLGGHGRHVGLNFVSLSRDFEYAGLSDIDENRLDEFSKIFSVPAANCFTDYSEAFQKLEADAVLIEASSPAHLDICKAALQNNLHILVEKPFVLKMDDAYLLIDQAEKRNLKIMVNQNYRYYHTVLALKNALKNRVLGSPLFVNVQFYYNHAGRPYQCEMKDFMLLEMAIHHIDMIRFLFDSDIAEVTGKTWNIPDSMYKGDPNVHAVYETENGIPVIYTGSLVSKGLSTPWEGIWRIQCEDGSIHLQDLGKGYGVYIADSTGKVVKSEYSTGENEGISCVLSEFAAAIREDREPAISAKDNIKTLAALFATSASSQEGRAISPAKFLRIY